MTSAMSLRIGVCRVSDKMFGSVFSENKQMQLCNGNIKLNKYGLMSWPLNIKNQNSELKPLLFHAMLRDFKYLTNVYSKLAGSIFISVIHVLRCCICDRRKVE